MLVGQESECFQLFCSEETCIAYTFNNIELSSTSLPFFLLAVSSKYINIKGAHI